MSCQDATCIELKSCKWDMSISSVWCENTFAPPVRYEIADPAPVDYDTLCDLQAEIEDLRLDLKRASYRKPYTTTEKKPNSSKFKGF
jgi:hypothetical protein